MRGALPAAVVATFAMTLAGCADGGADVQSADLQKAVQAAENLEVEATDRTGVIRGVVVDDALRPLAGAEVGIAGTEDKQTTSELGAFGFDGLDPGTYFLTATLRDYTTVQQSVEVVAGVNNPTPVKILLNAIPRATPFIEALTSKIFVDGSFATPVLLFTSGGFTSDYGYWFSVAVQPNGTVAQTELTWDMTSPLAETARIVGGTYGGDDDIDAFVTIGPSPVIARAVATDGNDTADEVYYQVWAYDSAGLPVGVMAQQEVNAFIHVFHNFEPDPDWQFGRDGEHPIPK